MQIHSYVCQVQIRTRIQNIMKYCNERIYKNIKRNCTVIINTSVVRTNPSTQSSLPSSPALAFCRDQTGHDVDSTTSAHRLPQTSMCSSYIAHACARTQRAHTHRRRRARVPADMQTGIQAQWKQRYARIHYGTLKRRKSLILSICYNSPPLKTKATSLV